MAAALLAATDFSQANSLAKYSQVLGTDTSLITLYSSDYQVANKYGTSNRIPWNLKAIDYDKEFELNEETTQVPYE